MSRERNLTVRVTLEERKTIRAAAAAAGKDVSSFVRDLAAEDLERRQRVEARSRR